VTALLLWAIGLPSAAWATDHNVTGEDKVCLYDPVRIEGNRFFETERLLSEIQVRPNSSQDARLLEKDIDRILTLYEENGFPYCQVSPSHFRISKAGGLSFSFLVEEGPRVQVKEIRLEGLKTTKEKVILRELGKGLFGFFSQTRVDAGLRRIERLSYIKEVKETQLLAGSNPEEGLLEISLVEGKNNSFSGVLGYAPGSGDREGNLFGKMELVFDNIFGTGRMTRWNWSKKDPYSSQLSFLYREPWLLGFPPTLELGFRQADYDSTYMQLSFSAKLVFNSTGRFSWGIQAGWEKTVPGTAGKTYLPHSRRYSIGAVFWVDLLDRPANPRKGLFYQAEVSYARKRNHATSFFSPDKQTVSSKQISLDLNHFLPTFRKQTFSIGLHLKALNTDEKIVPLSDQFRLGGINSIRGYREEEFSGTGIAWVNVEYRFLLRGNSRIFFFTDFGYFERNALAAPGSLSYKISGEKSSYGLGLRMDSKAGLLGIDYGLGEGDSFSQGKIHFGITNRF
jgi:outer membrane protein assembly factor BamA